MIHALYEEVEDLACKDWGLGGEYHFMYTIQNNDCIQFIKKKVPRISLSKQLQINIGWKNYVKVAFYIQIGRENIERYINTPPFKHPIIACGYKT